jgi:hypothetical protein
MNRTIQADSLKYPVLGERNIPRDLAGDQSLRLTAG